MEPESWAALGIVALVLLIAIFGKGGNGEPPSRFDCAEVDQDHVINDQGKCTVCGKNFRRKT